MGQDCCGCRDEKGQSLAREDFLAPVQNLDKIKSVLSHSVGQGVQHVSDNYVPTAAKETWQKVTNVDYQGHIDSVKNFDVKQKASEMKDGLSTFFKQQISKVTGQAQEDEEHVETIEIVNEAPNSEGIQNEGGVVVYDKEDPDNSQLDENERIEPHK